MSARPPKPLKLLFADDERSLRDLMAIELRRMGHQVVVAADGRAAIEELDRGCFDCLLVDLDMPGASGIEVIAHARHAAPDAEAIILTGKSTKESAIEAVRLQVFNYLTKPCRLADLKAILAQVAEKLELRRRLSALERQLDRVQGQSQLIGESFGMQRVRQLIAKVAPTMATVLILGETGTGKELVARALHQQSLRGEQPYVAINCGALPEALIESELFGHRKGAFTGADEQRIGLFEVASGGTLFLDEIGELPRAMQAKLLRVLESREIRRVGDNDPRTVDVRIVCATHRNLPEMVESGDFREDLMFRINTFEIHLPALRERRDDIMPLAEHMLTRFRPGANCPEPFTHEACDVLLSHTWPGNVRELANVVERASILCDALPITPEHLPLTFHRSQRIRALGPVTLKDLELRAIHEALERHGGNKPKAAEELGVSLKTLYNKLSPPPDDQRKIA